MSATSASRPLPLTLDGYGYLLVIIDRASRRTECVPMKATTVIQQRLELARKVQSHTLVPSGLYVAKGTRRQFEEIIQALAVLRNDSSRSVEDRVTTAGARLMNRQNSVSDRICVTQIVQRVVKLRASEKAGRFRIIEGRQQPVRGLVTSHDEVFTVVGQYPQGFAGVRFSFTTSRVNCLLRARNLNFKTKPVVDVAGAIASFIPLLHTGPQGQLIRSHAAAGAGGNGKHHRFHESGRKKPR